MKQSGLIEIEIGPDVLYCNVQQTRALQYFQTLKSICHKSYVYICHFCKKFLQSVSLLNSELEKSRSNLVFGIRNHSIFGMLYCNAIYRNYCFAFAQININLTTPCAGKICGQKNCQNIQSFFCFSAIFQKLLHCQLETCYTKICT